MGKEKEDQFLTGFILLASKLWEAKGLDILFLVEDIKKLYREHVSDLEREFMLSGKKSSCKEDHKLKNMIKVKFPKEQMELLNNMGTIVNTVSGETYRYLPQWFRETEEEGVFELFTFENLPDELIDTIKDMRK